MGNFVEYLHAYKPKILDNSIAFLQLPFSFEKGTEETEELLRKITNTIKLQIKNTGTKNWDNGFTFHCLDKHSELLGMSYNIMHVVEPQNDVDATLIFNLDDNQNCLNDITRSLFVSYWQMFDKNDLPFGEVTNNL